MHLLMTHNQAELEQTDNKSLSFSVGETKGSFLLPEAGWQPGSREKAGTLSRQPELRHLLRTQDPEKEVLIMSPTPTLVAPNMLSWLILLRCKGFVEPTCAAVLPPASLGEQRSQRIKETGVGALVPLPGFVIRPKPQALYLLWVKNCPVSARGRQTGS